MKKILSGKLPRILKNKKKLEKILDVKITNRGKEVYIEGDAENEYIAEQVVDALNFGFPFSSAIAIKQEELILEKLNIKEHTNRKDLGRVRARIIGTGGKTLKTLSELSDCFLELKDNEIGIIGSPENVARITEAFILLVKGAKQGNVYGFLERNQPRPLGDLGLKEKSEN